MIKDRKHPDPETLLKHVLSDDNISHNGSGQNDFDTQSSKAPDIGTLNSEITEMEKIKSVGKHKFLYISTLLQSHLISILSISTIPTIVLLP